MDILSAINVVRKCFRGKNYDTFGYKVIHYRNGNVVFSDTASHKEMGLSLLGEALGFER